jgi:hypothetical protein
MSLWRKDIMKDEKVMVSVAVKLIDMKNIFGRL